MPIQADEYLESPELRLTPEDAERLCGVERTICKAALNVLVDAKFLCVAADSTYVRRTDAL